MTSILDIPGTTLPNRFSLLIQEATTSIRYPLLFSHLVEKIIDAIATSYYADQAIWELWDAFFIAVTSCPPPYDYYIALLDAIRAQPPSKPKVPRLCRDAKHDGQLHWSELPGFDMYWGDAHSILLGRRNWNGIRDPGTEEDPFGSTTRIRPDQLYLRMCIFSATLMKHGRQTGVGYPMTVFYACRYALERVYEAPPELDSNLHSIPLEQVRALDIRVAAIWLRDGGWALWNTDHEELREHFAVPLDDETELWPSQDGLTPERWGLWEKRLWDLSTDEDKLDEETRAVVKEAYEVVEGILDSGE
ncbi:uncharacterized protein J4E78_008269 [Alternaria triticimaculans]|uniref:uncharacterized protein n=1 Tax=Alternaria triticimaculans TaxID=297637 RepID=UPI0020C48828|nr:uncharacterized protein J4E78_008269 [Alternaria triticimaculans]KAI4649988.1 hypothetical protein J4E78_008269 [Alternaria triticimaculans]